MGLRIGLGAAGAREQNDEHNGAAFNPHLRMLGTGPSGSRTTCRPGRGLSGHEPGEPQGIGFVLD